MTPTKTTPRNTTFSRPMTAEYDLTIGVIQATHNNYIIDTGAGSADVAPVLDYIDRKKPTIVINTHCHWDHIFGNHIFATSPIIAHTTCRDMIPTGNDWHNALQELQGKLAGEVHFCPPNLTFHDKLHFPNDGITIFHTPGHSRDCISVYDAVDKVLYAGDNIGDTENEIVPWIDTDPQTFRQMIETYKTYDFEICICGHNKPQPKSVLARMENALPSAWEKQKRKEVQQ